MSMEDGARAPDDRGMVQGEAARDRRLPARVRAANEVMSVNWRATELDLSQLRAAFLKLMDRAMKIVEGAGWSPDDVVCERRLRCVAESGARWECEATSLTDSKWLLRTMGMTAETIGAGAARMEQVRVVELVCVCHAERWPERTDPGARNG